MCIHFESFTLPTGEKQLFVVACPFQFKAIHIYASSSSPKLLLSLFFLLG